jgi:type I restriction enzyme S subunit
MQTYDKYKDSGVDWIGEIPDDWSCLPLRRLVQQVKTGSTPSGAHEHFFESNGLKWYSPGDFYEGIYLNNSKKSLSESGINEVNIFPKNTVMLVGIGATIGKVGLSQTISSCNQQINTITCGEKLNPVFLTYYLKTLKDYILKCGKYTTMPIINQEETKNLLVVVPPLCDQISVISYLDEKIAEIDSLIAQKQRLIYLYEEEKSAIINNAVTKGLDPSVKIKNSGVEYLGAIPEEWKVKRLRYTGSCKNGVSAGADYFGSGFPFVSYSDAYKNAVLPEEIEGLAQSTNEDRENYSILSGDVLFTRTSETIDEIGFSSICLKTIENSIFAGFLIRFRPFPKTLDKGFSKYYFRSSLHRRFFVKEMNLVTRASLSQGLLKKLPVLLPPIREQQDIAGFLDEETARLNVQITKTQRIIELQKEYRTALISEVVTGKVKIPALASIEVVK